MGKFFSCSDLETSEDRGKDEWEKHPKYRCAKLVASYLRRPEAVIAAKAAYGEKLTLHYLATALVDFPAVRMPIAHSLKT